MEIGGVISKEQNFAMTENNNEIVELVEAVRPKLRRQNVGFQSRFGTSDISQELAVQLIEYNRVDKHNRTSDEPATSSLAWLSKVGKNVASKLRRYNSAAKRSVDVESEFDNQLHSSGQTPIDIAAFRELSTELIIAISSLDSVSRLIIDGHYNKGMSLNAIAEDLELSPRSVQRKHLQAIAELRRSIVVRRRANQQDIPPTQ